MDAVDLDRENEPAKVVMTGDPEVWLIGMELPLAKELLANIGLSLRVAERCGCPMVLTRDFRPFRLNVGTNDIHQICEVLGRG